MQRHICERVRALMLPLDSKEFKTRPQDTTALDERPASASHRQKETFVDSYAANEVKCRFNSIRVQDHMQRGEKGDKEIGHRLRDKNCQRQEKQQASFQLRQV